MRVRNLLKAIRGENWFSSALGFAVTSLALVCFSRDLVGYDDVDSALACDSYLQCQQTEVDVDYMFWWTNGTTVPSLVSTSPLGVPQGQAGVLPNATVLFGAQTIDDGLRGGGRVQLLRWLDKKCDYALDLSYFGAGSASNGDFSSNTDIHPILARPFFNVASGSEDSELVSFPGQLFGAISIDTSSEFHSASTLIRTSINRSCDRSLDFVAGYRYFKFREGMEITERLISTNPVGLIAQGTTFDIEDRFSAVSYFNGAEIGVVKTRNLENLTFRCTAKLAAGGVRKNLVTAGRTKISVPLAGSVENNAGFYALPSNIGSFHEDDFALLPELGLRTSLRLTEGLNFSIGYTALCLTNVLRVGSAMDRNVDVSQIPPFANPAANRPTPLLSDTGLFAQSIALGVEWTR